MGLDVRVIDHRLPGKVVHLDLCKVVESREGLENLVCQVALVHVDNPVLVSSPSFLLSIKIEKRLGNNDKSKLGNHRPKQDLQVIEGLLLPVLEALPVEDGCDGPKDVGEKSFVDPAIDPLLGTLLVVCRDSLESIAVLPAGDPVARIAS